MVGKWNTTRTVDSSSCTIRCTEYSNQMKQKDKKVVVRGVTNQIIIDDEEDHVFHPIEEHENTIRYEQQQQQHMLYHDVTPNHNYDYNDPVQQQQQTHASFPQHYNNEIQQRRKRNYTTTTTTRTRTISPFTWSTRFKSIVTIMSCIVMNVTISTYHNYHSIQQLQFELQHPLATVTVPVIVVSTTTTTTTHDDMDTTTTVITPPVTTKTTTTPTSSSSNPTDKKEYGWFQSVLVSLQVRATRSFQQNNPFSYPERRLRNHSINNSNINNNKQGGVQSTTRDVYIYNPLNNQDNFQQQQQQNKKGKPEESIRLQQQQQQQQQTYQDSSKTLLVPSILSYRNNIDSTSFTTTTTTTTTTTDSTKDAENLSSSSSYNNNNTSSSTNALSHVRLLSFGSTVTTNAGRLSSLSLSSSLTSLTTNKKRDLAQTDTWGRSSGSVVTPLLPSLFFGQKLHVQIQRLIPTPMFHTDHDSILLFAACTQSIVDGIQQEQQQQQQQQSQSIENDVGTNNNEGIVEYEDDEDDTDKDDTTTVEGNLDDPIPYNVITVEYAMEYTLGHYQLVRRLRQRYPSALIILIQLYNVMEQIQYVSVGSSTTIDDIDSNNNNGTILPTNVMTMKEWIKHNTERILYGDNNNEMQTQPKKTTTLTERLVDVMMTQHQENPFHDWTFQNISTSSQQLIQQTLIRLNSQKYDDSQANADDHHHHHNQKRKDDLRGRSGGHGAVVHYSLPVPEYLHQVPNRKKSFSSSSSSSSFMKKEQQQDKKNEWIDFLNMFEWEMNLDNDDDRPTILQQPPVLSDYGHTVLANNLRQVILESKTTTITAVSSQSKRRRRVQKHHSTTRHINNSSRGTWGSGDDCRIWYDTGLYNIQHQGGIETNIPDTVTDSASSSSSSSSTTQLRSTYPSPSLHKHAIEFYPEMKSSYDIFRRPVKYIWFSMLTWFSSSRYSPSNKPSSSSSSSWMQQVWSSLTTILSYTSEQPVSKTKSQSTTNTIQISNPFRTDRMLYLTYLTDDDNSYPRIRILLNNIPSVIIEPFASNTIGSPFDTTTSSSDNNDDNNIHMSLISEEEQLQQRHFVRTSAVGYISPGTVTTVTLDILQTNTPFPFRLLGASLLANEVTNDQDEEDDVYDNGKDPVEEQPISETFGSHDRNDIIVSESMLDSSDGVQHSSDVTATAGRSSSTPHHRRRRARSNDVDNNNNNSISNDLSFEKSDPFNIEFALEQ